MEGIFCTTEGVVDDPCLIWRGSTQSKRLQSTTQRQRRSQADVSAENSGERKTCASSGRTQLSVPTTIVDCAISLVRYADLMDGCSRNLPRPVSGKTSVTGMMAYMRDILTSH